MKNTEKGSLRLLDTGLRSKCAEIDLGLKAGEDKEEIKE